MSGHAIDVPAKFIFAIILSAFLLVGIVAVIGASIPFDILQARVRGLSVTGQVRFFTFDFYHQMQIRLRLIGAANIVLALFVILFRSQVLRSMQRVLADSRMLRRDIKSAAKSIPPNDIVVLGGLTLLAIVLRVPLLSQPMRHDETYSFVEYSSHPFYAALSFYDPNNHLLNTLFVRVAYLIFGNHPWALRLPVFFAGVCLVPAVYIATRSLYRSPGALLAAGLVASSSVLIEFSTNARGYSLVCLAFVLLIPISAYVLRNKNFVAWSLFAIIAALGFYAIPIMLYPFGGLVIWLALSALCGNTESSFRNMVIVIAVSACVTLLLTVELYTPVLAVFGLKSLVSNKWVVASPLRTFLDGLPLSLASTWKDWNRSIPLWLSLIFVVGFLISLLMHRHSSNFRIPLMAAILLWTVPVVFAQRVVPPERVWLFALPLYFITSAAGLATAFEPLLKRYLGVMVALIAVAVSVFLGFGMRSPHSAYLTNSSRGLDLLAIYLKTELKAGDSVVVYIPSNAALYYYFQKQGVPTSVINAPKSRRELVVVNDAAGDTVQKVLESTKLTGNTVGAHLIARFDLVELYEVFPSDRLIDASR